MEQLSSIDATFLQAETPQLPMHVCSVSVYDPGTSPAGRVSYDDIVGFYRNAMCDVPLLRRRLLRVPGELDLPYWIEDPDFDLDYHVRRIALARPGDWNQFHLELAEIHAEPLDLSRPPWEVYVIEGLGQRAGIPAGAFAIVQKVHHAAIDGVALRRLFIAMHRSSPDAPLAPPRTGFLVRESKPGVLPLWLKSYQHAVARPAKLSQVLWRAARGAREVSRACRAGRIEHSPASEPCRFNGPVSSSRAVTSVSFPFDEFERLRHAVPGATLNDLAISVIAGGLRHYLAGKGEPVDRPLIVQVPVNVRSDDQGAEDGNKISAINVSTCSHIADPVERLQAIVHSTRSGKERLACMGSSVMEDMADALGPWATRTIFSVMEHGNRIQALTGLKTVGPNLAFSNMVGAATPLYLGGARLVWGIGLGPLMPNMGLFVTGNSGMGLFSLGVNACRGMMPDPEAFAYCLRHAYDECLRHAHDESSQALAPEPALRGEARPEGQAPVATGKPGAPESAITRL